MLAKVTSATTTVKRLTSLCWSADSKNVFTAVKGLKSGISFNESFIHQETRSGCTFTILRLELMMFGQKVTSDLKQLFMCISARRQMYQSVWRLKRGIT